LASRLRSSGKISNKVIFDNEEEPKALPFERSSVPRPSGGFGGRTYGMEEWRILGKDILFSERPL
jgi:hypothetical protein